VLPIADDNLTLATWQILIRLELENAHIKLGSVRQIPIQEGAFESQTTSKTRILTVTEHARALSAQATARLSGSRAAFGGAFAAKFNAGRERKSDGVTTEIAKGSHEIIIVGLLGTAITIGDPEYGDPHKPHGLLCFTYPADVGDNAGPLLVIEPIDLAKPIRVTIMTTVPFGKLCLLPSAITDHVRQLAHEELEQRGREAIESHEELRNQFLHDEIAARVASNQKRAALPVQEGEFAVMIEMFEIRPIGEISEPGQHSVSC
jgi:hypothetical protein